MLKGAIDRFFKVGSGSAQRGDCSDSTMQHALNRLKSIGLEPDMVFDVGAAVGSWAIDARKVWTRSEYILIEPLAELCSRMPENLIADEKVKVVMAAAGAEAGKAMIHVTDDLYGSGIYNSGANVEREVEIIAIDDLHKPGDAKQVLMKLDTHGFEAPILQGAARTMEQCCALIVEVYGFHISPTALLFHEISALLREKGFRLFDLVDILRRQKDHAFWQADAIYIRENHPLMADNTYS